MTPAGTTPVDAFLRAARRPAATHGASFLPAAFGACLALFLGGAGFGLGCLYGVLAPGTGPARLAAAPLPPVPMPAPAPVGGPIEDSLPVTPFAAGQTAGVRTLAQTGAPGRAQPARLPPDVVPSMGRPVVGGWISSPYGPRPDPFTGRPAVHQGLDFAGLDNSAILAAAPGVVTWSGPQRGYGNLIEIDHGNGWVTRYGHNASNLVQPGDYVKPGQTIALMGATGRATGTHLHFEVLHRGRHQNPARLVPRSA